MRVTWIGGWGVAPEALRPVAEKYFPESRHTFLAPTMDAVESSFKVGRVTPCAPSCRASRPGAHGVTRPTQKPDVLVAWSLGAWRVLEAASRGGEFPGMVLLLAPFVAFPTEAGLGGKCGRTQVKYLRRWLQREPLAALTDFHQRAGLLDWSASLPPTLDVRAPTAGHSPALQPSAGLPYAMTDLIEGLDRLAEDASPALGEFAARGLPRNWQALVGDSDPLLDGGAVCRAFPGCTLLRGAGHDIADLLRASQT